MSSTHNLMEIEEEEIEALLPQAQPPRTVRAVKRSTLLRCVIAQPLVHFLIAGLLLFVIAATFERSRGSNSRDIQVSAAEIQRLEDVWSRQYGRAPTATELKNLIEDFVREEVYYREALASGLDKEDSIIRRRLIEKMEFLSQEIASGDPSEKELQDYFDRNRERFKLPPQIAFSHIFFSPSKRGAALQGDVSHVLTALRNASNKATAAAAFGDAFMLQNEYPLQTPDEIRALFGGEFSVALFKLHPGDWQGPIRSSYGLHLVRITQYQRAHSPELNEVRTQVVTDFKNERLQTAAEKYYSRLRQRYTVQIDDAAVAAGTNQGPNGSMKRERSVSSPDVD